MTPKHRQWGGLVALLATTAIALAACSGSGAPTAASSPTVASLRNSSGHGATPTTEAGGGTEASSGASAATPSKNSPTRLVDEWAACERSHGDPGQADPIIDVHGVINITLPGPGQGGVPVGDPHDATGECSQYLAAAQIALRAADPVQDPLGVTSAAVIVNFANCMRANGVPNYPYPSGPNDSETNFNGTGVNPNSPSVVRVNDLCGKKLGLPVWWINGWGPPGDITVGMAGLSGNPPPCSFAKTGCAGGTNRTRPAPASPPSRPSLAG